jgi:hypothetical protein
MLKFFYLSPVSTSDIFLILLLSVSGYNNFDTARAPGAFITDAHSKCSGGTYITNGIS